MVQPDAETNSLTIEQAASLLMQTPQGQSDEQDAMPPDEAITDADLAMPLEADADDIQEYDLDEADAEEEDQADPDFDEGEFEEQDVYTVRVNGEDVDVTLEEALKGYQREADYTRKTQELAQARKAFEAEQQEFEAVRTETSQLRDAYGQTLQQLEQQMTNDLGQEPDWDQAYQNLDAKEYARLVQNWQTRKENLQKVQVERARVAKEQAREHEKIMRQHLAHQSDLMLQKLPQWKDEKVRNSERAELIAHAKTLGYTDDEIANAADHRAIVALYDSWQLSKINASTPEAKRKVRNAPKMAKAGVPRSKNEVASRRREKLRKRHAEEGSIASAVDLLLNR